MSIHLIRNIHTVLGSILLDRIFLEASAGCCCCCCCAGWFRTKRENTANRLQAEDCIDRCTAYQYTKLIYQLNARFDFLLVHRHNVSLCPSIMFYIPRILGDMDHMDHHITLTADLFQVYLRRQQRHL